MEKPNWKTAVGRVRWLGMLEGVSFLVLLGIAVPLKRLAGMPEMTWWTGWTHGLLLILYCAAIFNAWAGRQLSFKNSLKAFLASLVPFGTFWFDGKLAKIEAENPEEI